MRNTLTAAVKIAAATFVGIALSLAPPADAQSRVDAEEVCRQAVLARGNFGDVRFDPTNAVATRGDNYAVSGSFRSDRGRFAFKCSLDGRRVRDVDVSRLGGGEGRPDGAQTVTCESPGFGRDHCGLDPSRGVRLVEQTSNTRCVQGQSWGVDRRGVWLDQGCAGRFATAGGGESQRPRNSAPDPLNEACEREVAQGLRLSSTDVRAGRGTPTNGGAFEIEVRTPGRVYICTVNARGRVKGLEPK